MNLENQDHRPSAGFRAEWIRPTLLAVLLCLVLSGCTTTPKVSYDFTPSPPAGLGPLETQQKIAESLDYTAEVPKGEGFVVTYSTGIGHHVSGLVPASGQMKVPPDEKQGVLIDKQGRKSYLEYYHDADGRLLTVARNLGGESTPEFKLIYDAQGILASITYHEGQPHQVFVLARENGKPTTIASFKVESGESGQVLSKGMLQDVDPKDWASYQESLEKRPAQWTRETVMAHFEKYGKLPSARGPDNPKVPAALCLELAEGTSDPKLLGALLPYCSPVTVNIKDGQIEKTDGDPALTVRFGTLIKKHMHSDDLNVARRAIRASGSVLESSAELRAPLVKTARNAKDPESRLAALEVLLNTKNSLDDAEILGVALQCLASDSEPLSSWTADYLDRNWRSDPEGKVGGNSKVLAAAREGLSSPFPVVRGHAARKLVECSPQSEQKSLVKALRPLLDDAHPFVKAKAAVALADLGDQESIEKIVSMIEADKYAVSSVDLRLGEMFVRVEGCSQGHAVECYLDAFQKLKPEVALSGRDRKSEVLLWWKSQNTD